MVPMHRFSVDKAEFDLVHTKSLPTPTTCLKHWTMEKSYKHNSGTQNTSPSLQKFTALGL